MKTFDGKVCVITGAGSGIGRALAIKLAAAGAILELVDLSEVTLAETQTLLADGCDSQLHTVDVADRAQMDHLADVVAERRQRVDVLINNAGVALGAGFKYTEIKDLEWIMGINFWGVVYGCKAFLPLMQGEGEYSIVNISSVFGLVSGPTQAGYSASKFAVRGFSDAIRQESLSEHGKITVACAFPAGIKTAIAKNARVYNADQDEAVAEQGRQAMEKSFLTTADDAADDILAGIRKRQLRIRVGKGSWVLDMLARVMPVSYARFLWPKPKTSQA